MQKYTPRRGPEDIPLREVIDDLEIVVLIWDLSNDGDKPIRVETLNFSDPDNRRWLGKITAWACTNGHSVETMAKVDWEKIK